MSVFHSPPRTLHRNPSRNSYFTTNSDSFTVSTGGKLYVPPSSPLGISSNNRSRYIVPVPPTFITEYERAYTSPQAKTSELTALKLACEIQSRRKEYERCRAAAPVQRLCRQQTTQPDSTVTPSTKHSRASTHERMGSSPALSRKHSTQSERQKLQTNRTHNVEDRIDDEVPTTQSIRDVPTSMAVDASRLPNSAIYGEKGDPDGSADDRASTAGESTGSDGGLDTDRSNSHSAPHQPTHHYVPLKPDHTLLRRRRAAGLSDYSVPAKTSVFSAPTMPQPLRGAERHGHDRREASPRAIVNFHPVDGGGVAHKTINTRRPQTVLPPTGTTTEFHRIERNGDRPTDSNNAWTRLSDVSRRLIERGQQPHLLQSLLRDVLPHRRLDASIEYACSTARDTIAEGRGAGNAGASREVVELCRQFVSCVDQIKST